MRLRVKDISASFGCGNSYGYGCGYDYGDGRDYGYTFQSGGHGWRHGYGEGNGNGDGAASSYYGEGMQDPEG